MNVVRMIGIGVLALSLGLQSAMAQQPVGEMPAWGNAPDLELTSCEGDELHLSDFAGKPVVLNFWAEWCPPCVAELPLLEEAWKQYGEDVQFLTVNVEKGRMDPGKFLKGRDVSIPCMLAGDEAAEQYGISGIPATFFITSQGDVLGMKAGAFQDGELPYIIDAMLELEDSLMVTE